MHLAHLDTGDRHYGDEKRYPNAPWYGAGLLDARDGERTFGTARRGPAAKDGRGLLNSPRCASMIWRVHRQY